MPIITVFEHQTLTADDFANAVNGSTASQFVQSTQSDFHWLLAKIEAGLLPCFTLGVQAGQVVIYVGHYLSVILLPSGDILEILPKISKPTKTTTAIKTATTTEINETHQWVSLMLSEVYQLKRYLPVLASSQESSQSNSLPSSQQSIPSIPSIQNTQTYDKIHNKNRQTWFQLITQPIAEQLFRLLTQLQLPKNYQQQQQNHPQAQGKLLIKQQLKHNSHRPHYRYTSQQQFSLNSLWGQFFLTSIHQLQTLGIDIPPVVRKKIVKQTMNQQLQSPRQAECFLESLPPNQWQPSYQQLKHQLTSNSTQLDKHNQQQLTQALELAWFILQLHNFPDTNISNNTPIQGDKLTLAVMINMQHAFEKWVTIKFAEQFANLGKLTAQRQSAWLINGDNSSKQRQLQPDIIIENNNIVASDNLDNDYHNNVNKTDKSNKTTNKVTELIADIKYKAINKASDISSSDLYQLFTYQQHWQAKQAWLIFPKTAGLQQPQHWQVTDKQGQTQLTIKVVPFDMLKGELVI